MFWAQKLLGVNINGIVTSIIMMVLPLPAPEAPLNSLQILSRLFMYQLMFVQLILLIILMTKYSDQWWQTSSNVKTVVNTTQNTQQQKSSKKCSAITKRSRFWYFFAFLHRFNFYISYTEVTHISWKLQWNLNSEIIS